MKVSTHHLTGPALDWAVAISQGYVGYDADCDKVLDPQRMEWVGLSELNFSTDWTKAGPLIEKHAISVKFDDCAAALPWIATSVNRGVGRAWLPGDTALEAAMRALVAEKLGAGGDWDVLDVPDALMDGQTDFGIFVKTFALCMPTPKRGHTLRTKRQEIAK